jgi:hypothetical protein
MSFSSLGRFPEKILPDYVGIGKDFPPAERDVIFGQHAIWLRKRKTVLGQSAKYLRIGRFLMPSIVFF